MLVERTLGKKENTENPVKEECPLHKWDLKEQQGMPGIFYMKCTKCNKSPQDLMNESD
jgi:hypothetical protein